MNQLRYLSPNTDELSMDSDGDSPPPQSTDDPALVDLYRSRSLLQSMLWRRFVAFRDLESIQRRAPNMDYRLEAETDLKDKRL